MANLAAMKKAAHITRDEQGRPVVQIPLQLWEDLLEQLEPTLRTDESASTQADAASLGTLAALAASALRLGLDSGHVDTSERSREILNTEFADYITRKMRKQDRNGDTD